MSFELPIVLVELFVTVFTSNETEITDIIMDMVLIEGSTAYFKAMLLFFQYYEKELLSKKEFCN